MNLMSLTEIEDITPYDVYSCLTIRDSIPAKHVSYISELLLDTLLDEDKQDRITISQPPRTGKSRLITLSFPFWLILMNPLFNILIVNYNQTLADDFGMKLRQLFLDNEELLVERNIYLSYREHSKSKLSFENDVGKLLGSIKLVGTGGAITGRDVDICIIDDYIKGIDDCTINQLDKLYNWFRGVLLQRLEPESKLFILATRWHTKDLIGRLKEDEPDKYRFVELKAINDDGTCIWDNRYTSDFFNMRRAEMGDRLFESLYQQNPLDETGDYFNIDNIFYNDDYKVSTNHVISKCRSWDLAYTSEDANKSSDYTAGAYIYKNYKNEYILSDLIYGKFGEENINKIKSTAQRDTPNTPILIETGTVGAAAGELYEVYKKRLAGYNVKQSLATASKIDRAFELQQIILDGKFGITIANNELRGEVLKQLKSFPYGKHDDIIDAVAYGVNYLLNSTMEGSIGVSGVRNRNRRFYK